MTERPLMNKYNNRGERKTFLPDPRHRIIGQIRRQLTLLEMELMEDVPNDMYICSLALQMLEVIRELEIK